jgi:long-chain fatty acid transport protein
LRPGRILSLLVALLPTTAAASPLFELVGGAQGRGGLNARATGASAASTYFNPAFLPDARKGLELGIFFLSDRIDIAVDPRSSSPACHDNVCDVPSVFGSGPESFQHENGDKLPEPTVPTDWLENGRPGTANSDPLAARPRQEGRQPDELRAYQLLGLVSPVFGERLVLGFYAMIPLSEFTTARAFYNDEREQYFSNSLHAEMYEDRLTATSLAFGVGSRLSERWSVGATLTLSLTNRASAPVYVSNLSNLDTVLLDSDIGVEASVAPHFGAAFQASKWLQLSATLHTKQVFEIETGFQYFLATGSEQSATVSFTHAYMPLTAALGAEVAIVEHFSAVATLQYANWSDYKDRHSETPHPDYAWSDTLDASVGLRHKRGRFGSFVDANYLPSPVPAQTGRTNYVDNDRVGVAGGVSYEFELWDGHFEIGAQLQAHRLLARHVDKFIAPPNPQPNPNLDGFADNHYPQLVIDEVPDDAVDGQLRDPVPGREGLQTNNPGFPGFGSEGWILGGALNLSILY